MGEWKFEWIRHRRRERFVLGIVYFAFSLHFRPSFVVICYPWRHFTHALPIPCERGSRFSKPAASLAALWGQWYPLSVRACLLVFNIKEHDDYKYSHFTFGAHFHCLLWNEVHLHAGKFPLDQYVQNKPARCRGSTFFSAVISYSNAGTLPSGYIWLQVVINIGLRVQLSVWHNAERTT